MEIMIIIGVVFICGFTLLYFIRKPHMLWPAICWTAVAIFIFCGVIDCDWVWWLKSIVIGIPSFIAGLNILMLFGVVD